MTMPGPRVPELPPAIEAIRASIASVSAVSNLDALGKTWEAHVERLRTEVPAATIEGGGEVVFLGGISPGCVACKAGSWDCVFVGMRCNLACEFCYSPHTLPADFAGSGVGSTVEQILENHARTTITGISFSGGEPFLDVSRLCDWLARFKEASPDTYFWTYTNGLLADERSLRTLGRLGLNEIRFNAAATGYTHRGVMEAVADAARFIPNVTIEVPAIPEHAPALLGALSEWADRGARYLNLHELIFEPRTNSASMGGRRQVIRFEDGHRSEFNPDSRQLTLRVMIDVAARGIPLAVNDCSMQSKRRQIRGRRRCLAPLTKASHEAAIGDERFETCCVIRSPQDYWFCHPDAVAETRVQHPGCRIVRMQREAPLFLQEASRWVLVEDL